MKEGLKFIIGLAVILVVSSNLYSQTLKVDINDFEVCEWNNLVELDNVQFLYEVANCTCCESNGDRILIMDIKNKNEVIKSVSFNIEIINNTNQTTIKKLKFSVRPKGEIISACADKFDNSDGKLKFYISSINDNKSAISKMTIYNIKIK